MKWFLYVTMVTVSDILPPVLTLFTSNNIINPVFLSSLWIKQQDAPVSCEEFQRFHSKLIRAEEQEPPGGSGGGQQPPPHRWSPAELQAAEDAAAAGTHTDRATPGVRADASWVSAAEVDSAWMYKRTEWRETCKAPVAIYSPWPCITLSTHSQAPHLPTGTLLRWTPCFHHTSVPSSCCACY